MLSTGVSVDVNTIPTDLIDRVDVVTGGNSAVYGSDAIAGVVNFVLKHDYRRHSAARPGRPEQIWRRRFLLHQRLSSARISPAAAATSRSTSNMPASDQAWGAERHWLVEQSSSRVDRHCKRPATEIRTTCSSRTSAGRACRNTGSVRFGGTILAGTGAHISGLNCGLAANGTGSSAFYTCPFIFHADRPACADHRNARRSRAERAASSAATAKTSSMVTSSSHAAARPLQHQPDRPFRGHAGDRSVRRGEILAHRQRRARRQAARRS